MRTTRSLFACAASDVTLDRVRDLVANSPLESLTLEFKERYTTNVVKSIAATRPQSSTTGSSGG